MTTDTDVSLSRRRPWALSLIVLVIIVAIGTGLFWWQDKEADERACDRWRDDFRATAADAEEAMMAGSFRPESGDIRDNPLAVRLVTLMTEQPDGCPEPDSAFNELFDQVRENGFDLDS